MKYITRLISVFLMFIMGTICTFAVEITDFSQITDMNGTYELASDITLASDFFPVGTKESPFTGTFDGKGKTVSGSYTSLFGYTDGATVKNINAHGVALLSDMYFGGIVSVAEGKTVIEGCTFEGNVNICTDGLFSVGGGIAGVIGEDAVVKNCGSDVTLNITDKAYSVSFGGIVGENAGKVLYCHVSGSISADSDKYRINLGGIAGENRGTVEGCFNEAKLFGKVSSEASQLFAGGIVGVNNDGTIERAGNLGEISGEGLGIYPVYIGGVAGMNINGDIKIAKNTAVISVKRAFAGGIVGFNMGQKENVLISDVLNAAGITRHDSVVGGIAGSNVKTEDENSGAEVSFALNLSDDKGIAQNNGESYEIYNVGKEDGVSDVVTVADMKENGIPSLEKHNKIWVNNIEISALPDMLVVGDEEKAQLIASNIGDGGDVAYYLYSPDASGYAKAFTALYFNGSRYIGMDYVEKAPVEMYAKLKATKIPDGTTRIRFVAFAETFGTAFKPSEVVSAEIEYKK